MPSSSATSPLSISQLLCCDDAERIIAFGADGSHNLADFIGRTAALCDRLADGGARYLVHCDDAYGFAVALAALSTTGNIGVLAPNAQAGTIDELAPGSVGAIATVDTGIIGCIDPLSLPLDSTRSTFTAADPNRPLFEMFTSGSSGKPDRIVKALGHLESEVRVLEQSFHEIARSTRVFATVSPQHLYGLLFRVLWPLISGRPFQRETVLQPEELAARIATSDQAMLIGTPTHLRILASSPALALAAPKLRAVFSSGGPLAFETASAVEQGSGVAPIEIYGSTETGGIAHRRRTQADTPWTLLDRVCIEIEPEPEEIETTGRTAGRLIVTSPFVSAGESSADGSYSRFTTGDRVVRLADDPVMTFTLAGRADRTVQIAEKRINLSELEGRLTGHALVTEVAAASVHLQGTTRVGVLVVLSQAGRVRLAAEGRAALRTELSEMLSPFYDRVVLPRRWRFVPTLPCDAQGKTQTEAVCEALTHPLAESCTEPILLSDSSLPDSIERRYIVPNDLAYLEGHFDRFPLVAGVVQLKWALEAAGELLGDATTRPDPRTVKFKQVLRPLQEFTLRVKLDSANARADFSIANEEQQFSSGRFVVTTR
jgi:acyl-coenzyme A synthetase/AMP-(fatty) acid ligase